MTSTIYEASISYAGRPYFVHIDQKTDALIAILTEDHTPVTNPAILSPHGQAILHGKAVALKHGKVYYR